MKHRHITREEALAQGYSVDDTTYPWVAYRGARNPLNPPDDDQMFTIDTPAFTNTHPDHFSCRRCGQPVIYASVPRARINSSFDAVPILGGGYTLTEEEDALTGAATGRWTSSYTKVADRQPNHVGHRQHDCPAKRRDV